MSTNQRVISARLLAAVAVASVIAACSPGSLPGSPSRIEFGGGGGRYDGTLSYRRIGGDFLINESPQSMSMSLVLAAADQFTAQFQTAAGSTGSLQGLLTGALNNGTFRATLLATVPADSPVGTLGLGPQEFFRPRAAVTCEGRGEVTGSFSGLNVTWTIGAINYTNCRLITSSEAQATAVSPIPQAPPNRANVVLTIFPATTIRQGTCPNGRSGFPFTVEIAETNGVRVTLADTILVEEQRGAQVVRTERVDNPFTTLQGGEKRRYSACSPFSGTYQAFFSGRDANGNTVRFSSPVITFG